MKFKIFVINLDSSQQRLQRITQQCERLGLTFERISAVRGSELTQQEIDSVYNQSVNLAKYHKVLNQGEIGCYLSHIACWQQIVDQQLDYALILEDDAVLTDELVSFIEKIARLSAHWDYIRLSHGSRKKKVLDSLELGDGLRLQRMTKLNSTTTGQFVSLAGAGKLLAAAYPIARPVDIDIKYWYEKSLRCFSVEPFPVLTGNFSSEINQVSDRRFAKTRPLLRLWQKAKFEFALWKNRKQIAPFPKF